MIIKMKIRGHTYVARGVNDYDDIALVLGLWASNPQLDFRREDATMFLAVWRSAKL